MAFHDPLLIFYDFPGLENKNSKLLWHSRFSITHMGNRDGAVVRALASHQCDPGSTLARFHIWIEFVVGSRPCSEDFSPGSPVFLPLKN